MAHRIALEIAKQPMTATVKATTGDGFDTLEKWIADADVLVIRAGEREPMAVLPWSTFKRIAQVIEG